MSQRIKVNMYQSTYTYERVKAVASKIGMPVATLISMMVTDTNLKDFEVIPDDTTKLTDKRTPKKEVNVTISDESSDKKIKQKYVNITISDESYDTIYDKIEEAQKKYEMHNYYISDYVVDCINEQLKYFEYMEGVKPNKWQLLRERIKKSITVERGEKHYSQEVRKKYKFRSLLDDYIEDIHFISSVKSKHVKQYFLAKQMNQTMDEYDKAGIFDKWLDEED